jgi:hypothetical protein
MFSKKRSTASRKAKHLKCTASEGLSVYGVMGLFLQVVVLRAGRCTRAITSFIHLCGVIDILVAIPVGVVTADVLRAQVAKFLNSCVDAGWRDYMHPKFHWLVHLPSHLGRFKFLPTCWVHERKHRMVKRYASDVYNLAAFERTVLSEVTAHHVAGLDDESTFAFNIGLINSREAPAKLKAALAKLFEVPFFVAGACRTALQARFSAHGICNTGDVVLVAPLGPSRFDVGMVYALAEVLGEAVALVAVMQHVSADAATGTAQFRETQNLEVMQLSDVWAPLVYSKSREGIVRVLVPVHFRTFL